MTHDEADIARCLASQERDDTHVRVRKTAWYLEGPQNNTALKTVRHARCERALQSDAALQRVEHLPFPTDGNTSLVRVHHSPRELDQDATAESETARLLVSGWVVSDRLRRANTLAEAADLSMTSASQEPLKYILIKAGPLYSGSAVTVTAGALCSSASSRGSARAHLSRTVGPRVPVHAPSVMVAVPLSRRLRADGK
eukprot:CAMPEP_0182545338 /NCGR_PEP_ID=MMETSP1323-20130603/34411_1 /TAXON_ID=236787 /ORGANISM="Florenciella parvula, Strain RCC1693" /LENGTH=197 /DNA_ID=CAMNT_0024756481 /DNA_START=108 /DNA_END=701 /DNA_ORIENTATION=+